MEVNAEAARVAAFSLYLALLDAQEPPDIEAGGRLPHLIHTEVRDEEHFGILVVADAFALTGRRATGTRSACSYEKSLQGARRRRCPTRQRRQPGSSASGASTSSSGSTMAGSAVESPPALGGVVQATSWRKILLAAVYPPRSGNAPRQRDAWAARQHEGLLE